MTSRSEPNSITALGSITEFYKNYTYSKGFVTMIRNSRKKKDFTKTSYINLKCNREGTYSSSVDDASKNHNHDLSQSKFRHFATFRHIDRKSVV